MTVTYRAGAVGDAAALNDIFDTTFGDTFGHLYAPDDLAAFRSSFGIADWEAQLRDPAFATRIALVDDEPVGYVKIGPLKLPVEADQSSMLLDQFYILKGHQGSGIAPVLMDWALKEARTRGAPALYLTVFVENHRARRFYDRYGFEPVGRYDFMVGNHADEDIIMRKAL